MQARKISGRVICSPPLDARLGVLILRFEGPRHWLKSGAFQFADTPANCAAFKAFFPQCPIVDEASPSLADDPFATLASAHSALADVNAVGGALHGRSAAPATPIAAYPVNPGARPPLARQTTIRKPFAPKTAMSPSQAVGFAKLRGLRWLALTGIVGSGKTKLALDLTGDHYCAGNIDAMLVVAPNGVHAQWLEEAMPAHWTAAAPYCGLIYTRKAPKQFESDFKRLLEYREGLAVFTINHDGLLTKRAADFVDRFCLAFGKRVIMWFDESHRIKNHQSLLTKAVCEYRNITFARGIMTGTPRPKTQADLFSQYKFLDEKIIGYRYITTFKSRYCILGGFDGREVVGSINDDELAAKIAPYTYRVSDEDLGLERPTYENYPFAMGAEQSKAYKTFRDNFLLELRRGNVTAANGGVALLRLQQISCGFTETEDGARVKFENPRLAALKSVLAQFDDATKVIIWARFHYDIESICDALGDECVAYYGPASAVARATAKDKFLHASATRYFVASAGAAGTGLDGLQRVCRHAIYYSNSFNAVHRWQSEGRTQRIGMIGPNVFTDLVCRGSVDAQLLRVLRTRRSASDLMLDEIRKMIEGVAE